MTIVACISGWDDAELLAGCAASAAALGLPVVYADGAYPLYMRRGQHWASLDMAAVEAALAVADHVTIEAPGGPWPSEAAKKTALLVAARMRRPAPDWVLFLDTDERLETGPAWAGDLELGEQLWGTLDIYRPLEPPDGDGVRRGFPLPRLLRVGGDVVGVPMEFRPPRDFDVFLDGYRIAFLDGEPVPEHLSGWCATIPQDVLRIRHDRHLRPVDRTNQTGEYCVRRRAVHGVA